MDENDLRFIRAAIDVARRARDSGNHPFGALLVDEQGRILMEAENTVVTQKDCTGHAETNLVRQACRKYDRDFLAKCTIYTSFLYFHFDWFAYRGPRSPHCRWRSTKVPALGEPV